jgi:hypothetical protein
MHINTLFGFVDMFHLLDQRERRFGAGRLLRECQRLGVGRKRVIVIAAVFLIRRAPFRVAPDTILENRIPNVAAAGPPPKAG